MFSVMNTGICRRPSCTPMVKPSISGMIIDARDHVRITACAPDACNASTFFINLGWM
jgi:hypothetical protein